jgi:NTP pyrophosphatase (non-canonical NTP hydrolase)
MSSPEDNNFNDILRDAIDTFGEDLQMMVAIEEMAELTKVLSKVARYGMQDRLREKAKEEIADVAIMLLQLMMIFEFSDDDICGEVGRKVQRLHEGILRRKDRVSQT